MLTKRWSTLLRIAIAMVAVALIVISVRPELLRAGPVPEPCSKTVGHCCDCWLEGGGPKCEEMPHGTGVEECSVDPWNCPSDPNNWCVRQ